MQIIPFSKKEKKKRERENRVNMFHKKIKPKKLKKVIFKRIISRMNIYIEKGEILQIKKKTPFSFVIFCCCLKKFLEKYLRTKRKKQNT